ncbi:MAG: hypothetical protein CO030_00580 [Candidatus Magasanikbacteria bacterium CG_4_9_14_0_2_um_filter_42_11]|uniref:Uncharacterized protein n=1 Tax=Candidatus Magasanikbacteria bacterium CG_4_9_14_0_2_um_filter_42_11 TaxID=1974643 RepID=A0A2M8FAV4_9BACT|nr:MAG: hypothetical protein COY70_03695 [Candidatus Magasanikbacteria bacterium CG_4_10_14_0_8_um_filter_42_12]PJC52870.1 MAG: hypothetical protein CO030_00580 [Candidatus Magasanikbacteria bacterium CG_4_9_14_0_2_um_filter_42_11]
MNIQKYKLLLLSVSSLLIAILSVYIAYLSLPIVYDCCVAPYDDSNSSGEIAFLSTVYILAASLATVLYSKILKIEGNTLLFFIVTLLMLVTNFTIILNSKGHMTVGVIFFYVFLFSPFYLPVIYKNKKNTSIMK